ncbi:MAG TPA: sulfurtransferase TusA family protein [Nitrospirae bacterium]|nr:sulfurtransferase TusA [bacterium BMS3Abin06]HDH10722.1 sulfurtransferase TusA family protein [Nitrospirota bacterium]HDZ03010.1 sulfurtransferase TusA family protein [Nitrospirota bacterium]
MQHKEKVDKILDVQGLLCPVPTVMTSKALKEMKKGKALQVITNDITTKESIPSLCAQEGYNLLELKEREGLLYFTIRA